jgi:hypothetical protein
MEDAVKEASNERQGRDPEPDKSPRGLNQKTFAEDKKDGATSNF